MPPTYEQHVLARLLPPMGQEEFQRLAADLLAHGLLEEIVLYQGKILDGWSRYRACQVVDYTVPRSHKLPRGVEKAVPPKRNKGVSNPL
jgi:hypothetical protein